MIPNSKHSYREYLIKVNKSFFLIPTIPEEIFDIIVSLDRNKSLGPNSVPIYIIKIYSSRFFSEKLSHIINLSFVTGIFPDLCKIAKVIHLFKKDNELLCENYTRCAKKKGHPPEEAPINRLSNGFSLYFPDSVVG